MKTIGHLKILMLEDSITDAELIQRELRASRLQFEVKLMMQREAFEQALDSFKPDIVLSDNAMPQFNASEALKILRSRSKHIPFILVTGTVSEEFAAGIIKSGADDYLLKDRLTRLPGAIEAAVKQRRAEKENEDAARQLRDNEIKYRMLVERVSDAFVALDLNWNFNYVNSKAAELFGKPGTVLLGKNIWQEFPAGVDQTIFNAYQTAMETQENIYLNEYSFAMDKWVSASIYPSPSGLSVYLRDISAEKSAKQKILESEDKFRALIERMTDGYIALDKEWNYTYINQSAAKHVNVTPAQVLGRCMWEVFPDLIGTEIYKLFHKAMHEKVALFNTDYYAPHDTWQENHIYPTDEGIAVFIRDISYRKRAENKLKNSERRLREAQAVAHISNWEYEMASKKITWSNEMFTILGLDQNSTLPSIDAFLSKIYREDKDRVVAQMLGAVRSRKEGTTNLRLMPHDGALRYAFLQWKFEFFDGSSSPLRIYGIIQDVTEATTAAENLRSLEQQMLVQKLEEQKKIARAIIIGQEKERRYIGQELHDNVCQMLVGVKLHLGTSGVKNPEVKKVIEYPIELLDKSIGEIRDLSHRLVTPLKNINLEELVRELLYNLNASTSLQLNFSIDVQQQFYHDDLMLNVYRIIQEQIANVLKHAAASSFTLHIVGGSEELDVYMADDGNGFDPATKTNGIGLANIRHRIESYNGKLYLESAPGKGTKLHFTIPATAPA